jgi:general stress protein YciG
MPQVSEQRREKGREQRAGQRAAAQPSVAEVAVAAAKRVRGFAAMSKDQVARIASQGGRAAQATGRAHRFDADEARAAGSLGGQAVSKDRAYMAELGRIGGKKSAKRRAALEAAVARMGTEAVALATAGGRAK